MKLQIDVPILETERLRLREPRESDLADEAKFFQSERARFVGGTMNEAQTWRSIATLVGHWAFRGYGFWGVEEKQSGTYLGHVGLWYPLGWPEPEIGWTLMEHAEGKGFAFEAAVASRKYAYETLGWKTAISLIDPGNARSIKLAERLGATLDGKFHHGDYGDMHIYRHPNPDATLG